MGQKMSGFLAIVERGTENGSTGEDTHT